MPLAAALVEKLERARARAAELEKALAQPSPSPALWREHGRLRPLLDKYELWREAEAKLKELRAMAEEGGDAEWREMVAAEVQDAEAREAALADDLLARAAPDAEENERDCFVEIRAGVGGDEACLFAGDLLRMYLRYADARGWRAAMLLESPGEAGGIKEAAVEVRGAGAYGRLRFESGAHRVQRVPKTESQGRIHTSACTVAVLADAEDEGEISIAASDLRIDTFRASGAGGQHVNTTDSAVRITHIPSGTVVECQDERSQHKNRERAMSLLRARVADQRRRAREEEQAQTRRLLVGSGDRSQRVRTYNFPQGRVTDHRIGLTLHKLTAILEGDLDALMDALQEARRAELAGEAVQKGGK